jgi:hypothetical protein
MSRFRRTFLLVLVFVAFFSFFCIYQKDKKPPEPKSDAAAPETYQLTSYKPENLSEISWKSASYSATLQNPGDQKWKLITPPILSDEAKSKSYVDSLISLTGTQKIKAKDLTPADTGLNAPTLTINVKKKDNSTELLKIGAKTVDGDYYYSTKEGSDTITLLSSYVIDDLNKDPESLKPDPSVSPISSTTPQQ